MVKNSEKTQFRSGSEQVKTARKGGIASGEARRRKRDMKAYLTELSQMPIPDAMRAALERTGINVPQDADYYSALTMSMFLHGIQGDSRMVSLIMDVLGEKASDKAREKDLALREKALKQGELKEQKQEDDPLTKALMEEAERMNGNAN